MKKCMKRLLAVTTSVSLTVGLFSAACCLPTAKEASAATAAVEINETNFADSTLLSRARVCDNLGNQDGKLDAAETKDTTSIFMSEDLANITKYLQYFPYVTSLTVEAGKATSVTINKNLKQLTINSSATKPVTIVGGSKLENVIYYAEKKASLNFKKAKGYSNLKSLSVHGEKVKSVTIPNQKKIQALNVSNTGISKLDVSKCKKLTSLICYTTKIKSLNISANKNLKEIGASYSKLSKLNTSKNKKLQTLVSSETKLKKVDVTKNKKLSYLDVSNNKISKITTAKNTKLEFLNVGGNKLKSLDVTKNKKLTSLLIGDNKISKLKIKKGNKIKTLGIGGNKIKKFSLSNYKKLTSLDVGDDYALLKKIGFDEKFTIGIKVSKKKTHNLKKYLPKMKNCTFANAWEWSSDEYYSLTSDGTLKFAATAKSTKYPCWAFLSIVKGSKKMTLNVQY